MFSTNRYINLLLSVCKLQMYHWYTRNILKTAVMLIYYKVLDVNILLRLKYSGFKSFFILFLSHMQTKSGESCIGDMEIIQYSGID